MATFAIQAYQSLLKFDHFIAVDWSARNRASPVRPSRDAIWLAQASAQGRISVRYFRTRHACCVYLRKRLSALAKAGKRVLVGWDFSFSYPKGLAKALKLPKKSSWKNIWQELHELVEDEETNRNNRFAVGAELNRRVSRGSGPFWGVPSGQSGIFLGSKKDFRYPVITKKAVLKERRLVEQRVPKMQPAWKLAYAGSVGSQTLLGLPRLYQLRFLDETLRFCSLIWPFETDFDRSLPPEGACIIHAEIYPSMLQFNAADKIPDRAQVRAYIGWLQAGQSAGWLSNWLAEPAGLSAKERKRVVRHEGWVLGVE